MQLPDRAKNLPYEHLNKIAEIFSWNKRAPSQKPSMAFLPCQCQYGQSAPNLLALVRLEAFLGANKLLLVVEADRAISNIGSDLHHLYIHAGEPSRTNDWLLKLDTC